MEGFDLFVMVLFLAACAAGFIGLALQGARGGGRRFGRARRTVLKARRRADRAAVARGGDDWQTLFNQMYEKPVVRNWKKNEKKRGRA